MQVLRKNVVKVWELYRMFQVKLYFGQIRGENPLAKSHQNESANVGSSPEEFQIKKSLNLLLTGLKAIAVLVYVVKFDCSSQSTDTRLMFTVCTLLKTIVFTGPKSS